MIESQTPYYNTTKMNMGSFYFKVCCYYEWGSSKLNVLLGVIPFSLSYVFLTIGGVWVIDLLMFPLLFTLVGGFFLFFSQTWVHPSCTKSIYFVPFFPPFWVFYFIDGWQVSNKFMIYVFGWKHNTVSNFCLN